MFILSATGLGMAVFGILKALEVGPASDGSAYQEYALTENGRRLYIVLVALRQWGETCLFKKGELNLLLVDQKSGQPVKPLELRSQDGRLLRPEDLRTISKTDKE